MPTLEHFQITAGEVTGTPKEQPLGMSRTRAWTLLGCMTVGAAGIGFAGAVRVGIY